MKRNTGYKVATKILLKKTVNGVESQELYAIGRYNNGVFESVSAEEIAGLSNEDYDRCVSDTKQYINSKAGIENIDDIFTNESRSEDLEMCPLPQKENIISVTVEPTADGQHWNFIFTSSYPVAATDLQVFLKTGRYGTNNMFVKGQDRVNDPSIPKNLSGETATFRLELNGQSGTQVKDDFYVYKIAESIVMPIETEPEVPEEVQEIFRATATATHVSFSVRHTNDIVVDWGDGTVETNFFEHIYSYQGDGEFDSTPRFEVTFRGLPSDVSSISCGGGKLISVDVSKCFALTNLSCSGHSLETLDVANNPQLTSLFCGNNSLLSLDVSKNPLLTTLSCYGNQLKVLDVSKNPKLDDLKCDSNELSVLDISNNPELMVLVCSSNSLTALDVSKNIDLGSLYCSHNQLKVLDVSKNPKLDDFKCDSNELSVLDISHNLKLIKLDCASNQLSVLDVSKHTDLEHLLCGTNQLSSIDTSKNVKLVKFDCSGNKLLNLDVSNNINLKYLRCINSNLTHLDVAQNINLEELYCGHNQLGDLDVTSNPKLFTLSLPKNDINSLSLDSEGELRVLDCTSTLIVQDNVLLLAMAGALPDRTGKEAGRLKTGIDAVSDDVRTVCGNKNWTIS